MDARDGQAANRWRDNPEIRLTLVALAGGLVLVAAGTAGVAGTPLLVVGLLALAGLLGQAGRLLADTAWTSLDRHRYVADLWAGPVLAAVAVVVELGATAGEVQALGGLVGLVGMVNYFLRPVYHVVYGVYRWLDEAGPDASE